MTTGTFKNKILRGLDAETVDRLQLKPITLPAGLEIENIGQPIDSLIFLEDGIGSMTTTFSDGFQVEVGMYGCESVIGVSALIGTRLSLNRIYMQMNGYGLVCSMPLGRLEFGRSGRFHDLVLRSVQALLMQTCQSAACNAHHKITQRLSRWLLLCADRCESSTLPLTHEYLADMLGSNRSTVSVAAEYLSKAGLISYVRGKVVILDRPGLEQQACECYRVVRDHLASHLQVDQDC